MQDTFDTDGTTKVLLDVALLDMACVCFALVRNCGFLYRCGGVWADFGAVILLRVTNVQGGMYDRIYS